MMTTETDLRHTPLEAEHIALGAKMIPFGGWLMPLQYEGILAEYEANRKGVTLLDCSHMGEFLIEGDYLLSGLDRIVTFTLSDMPIKTCRYGVMLNDDGGVIDDLIVYRKGPTSWMIVVNAANIDKNSAHFRRHLTSEAKFRDVSFQTAKLDIQGPQSRETLRALVPGITKLSYYTFDEFDLLGRRALISRTGYTGELGYEIYYPWDHAAELWNKILSNTNVKPCGLGVRDVLRTEMCYSLYGHELDEATSPLEAGLDKFIDWTKEFLGKDGLTRQRDRGVSRTIGYFVSENRRAPRAHHRICTPDGKEVGEVTSGTFSPGLQRGIGIGRIEKAYTVAGQKLLVGDEKVTIAAEIAKRPFYKSGSLKS